MKFRQSVIISEYRQLKEFPIFEMNIKGQIRHIQTHELHSTYFDKDGREVTKFRKDGKRYLRSVLALQKKTFPIQFTM